MGAVYGSLDKDDDVLTVGLNRAVDALAKKLASIRTLGNHPKDAEPVMVRKGRFGPYVQHGQTVATLPRGTDMDTVTLDEAVALLVEKGKPLKAKGGKAGAKKTATKKTATKTTASKTTATKASATKSTTKKAAAPKKATAAKSANTDEVTAPAKAPRKAAAPRKKKTD